MAGEMPIGVQDFKEIREKDCLYIDKSDMIPQILSKRVKVHLYTRPRRFGKSLNLSMLDAYFNLKYPKNNKWFDGLKVMDCVECLEHRNAYLVIYLDFKDLEADTYELFLKRLSLKMSDLFIQYEYLKTSEKVNHVQRSRFDAIYSITVDESELMSSLGLLSRMLHAHHGKKVIILLDEYDNPINNTYDMEFQTKVIAMMRGMLSSALKGNESLEFGVITGVMQIAKGSIFSGLNSLRVNNVLSEDFDESFGFTDEEVRSILEDNGHPEKYQEAKEWYDGYRFGNTHVYNPWSLLNYVESNFKPQAYWAGTSGNSIIQSLLDRIDDEVLDELRILANGEGIVRNVDPQVTLADIGNGRNGIYSMMVMSGYLTAIPYGDRYELRLPNGEMHRVFSRMIENHLELRIVNGNPVARIDAISEALSANDVDVLEDVLYELFADSVGYHLLTNEHDYQMFLVGLLMSMNRKYRVSAEFEKGKGRYDILLESTVAGYPHVVIELKRSGSDADDDIVSKDAERALCQIKERDYIHGLKGDILLYGIAFRGKEPRIVSERIFK